ncbi:MAG: hypothetical protein ACTIL2_10175 [Corynebacterium sp.]|uniref:hypothetical protein n=1 Tax=Corynebacterium sp. TaxID=1720 RepID=UPI003F990081
MRLGGNPDEIHAAIVSQFPLDLEDLEDLAKMRGGRVGRFTTDDGEHLAVVHGKELVAYLANRTTTTAAVETEPVPDVPTETVDTVEYIPGPDVPVEVTATPDDGYRRITRRVVCEARRRVVDEAAGVTDLAVEFNVQDDLLKQAVTGQSWGHIRRPAPVTDRSNLSSDRIFHVS